MNEEKMIEMVKAFIEMLRADESRNSSGEPEKSLWKCSQSKSV